MWYSAVGSIVTVLLSLLAVPLAAAAQPPGKVYRIGYLGTNPPPADWWDAAGAAERGRSGHDPCGGPLECGESCQRGGVARDAGGGPCVGTPAARTGRAEPAGLSGRVRPHGPGSP